MRKNFKYLFEERKLGGLYGDEVFASLIIGLVTSMPIYIASYYSHGVLQRLGLAIILIFGGGVAFVSAIVMKRIRGREDKTFYAKVLGRGERPNTLKGWFINFIVYMLAVEYILGRSKVVKTRDYSP